MGFSIHYFEVRYAVMPELMYLASLSICCGRLSIYCALTIVGMADNLIRLH